MTPCLIQSQCSFFRRYLGDPVLAALIREYCYGTLQPHCQIGVYFYQTGHAPPENWAPFGIPK
jgi:hypothetical protein